MWPRFHRPKSDTWFALGLEFFAIVLGVLFALYVDEWRNERQVAEINAIAMVRLNEEILHNHELLKNNLHTVEERYERLAALKVDTDNAFIKKVKQFGGYSFPNLKKSVWQRIGNDALSNRIDPPYLIGATELYNKNYQITQLNEQVLELVLNETFHDPAHAPFAWNISLLLLQQQIQWEREALVDYEEFIHRFIDPEVETLSVSASAEMETANSGN